VGRRYLELFLIKISSEVSGLASEPGNAGKEVQNKSGMSRTQFLTQYRPAIHRKLCGTVVLPCICLRFSMTPHIYQKGRLTMAKGEFVPFVSFHLNAERFVDAILQKIPPELTKVPPNKKPRNKKPRKRLADELTDKMLKALRGIDALIRTHPEHEATFTSGGTGACCLPDYTCQITTRTNCTAAGGAYQGDDTGCALCPLPAV